jgi:hypothetical protein
MDHTNALVPGSPRRLSLRERLEQGKIGYAILWLLGVPIPVLLLIYAIRGCH